MTWSPKSKILTALFAGAAAFILSAVPYFLAESKTPPGRKFCGQVAYTEDQKMYFSFIRQAYDGKWAFNNRLTNRKNGDVFVNLQFLLVGRLMNIFHLSENAVYQLWRFLGALCLFGGFAFLASLFEFSNRRWFLALCIFGFGGGFGIFPAAAGAAHLLSKPLVRTLSPDLWSGLHPFQQILANPHFSLPHGIMLIGFAVFLLAENRRKVPYYYLSGLIFFLNGFFRPYDLITVAVIFPCYACIASIGNRFDLTRIGERMVPALMILPALGYHIWLFKFNPAFKYWSLQGHNIASLPAPWWHFAGFGLAGFLAIIRILKIKKQPLSKNEHFLIAWFGVIFFLEYIGLCIPSLGFSPQVGVPIIAPLILLGIAIKDLSFRGCDIHSVTGRRLAMGIIGLSVLLGMAGAVFYYGMRILRSSDPMAYYVNAGELAAWQWMNKNLEPESVVCALPNTSMNLGKYTSLCTIAGHYSVTPEYKKHEAEVLEFFSEQPAKEKIREFMSGNSVSYLYLGPLEQEKSPLKTAAFPWLAPLYKNSTVTILKVALQ